MRGRSVEANSRRSVLVGVALTIGLAVLPVAAESDPGDATRGDPGAGERSERVRRLLEQNQWRDALEVARDAVRRAPDDPGAAAELGAALFRAGRLREVESALEPVLAAEPVPLRALVTLARLRHAEGRGGDAETLIRRALDRHPDDRDVLYQASEIIADRRRALDLLRRYLARAEGDDPERVEAAEGARRVFEALGDTTIWFDVARPDSLELPLRRLWDPGTGAVQGYVVPVRLGGARRRVPLLLDSGSPGLYLIDRAAKRRGFEPLAERTVFGGGGDGRHATRRGMFRTFALDGLEFGNALATSTPDEFDPVGRYHGLLGFGIFGGYRATLDLLQARLTLHSRETGTDTVDNGAAPYWTVGGQLLVEVQVRTKSGQAEPALFLLDTGATRTLVALELAAELSGADLGRVVELHGFGGRRTARALTGVRVGFGGFETDEGSTRAVDLSRRSRLGGVEVSGFLGLDLLDGRVLTIDGPRRRVTLRNGRRGRGDR